MVLRLHHPHPNLEPRLTGVRRPHLDAGLAGAQRFHEILSRQRDAFRVPLDRRVRDCVGDLRDEAFNRNAVDILNGRENVTNASFPLVPFRLVVRFQEKSGFASRTIGPKS